MDQRAAGEAFHQPAIEILYQDEHLLLINKPGGLLSLSGKNPLNLDSVQDFAHAALAELLAERRIDRLVAGNHHQPGSTEIQSDDDGVIEAAIAKDPARFPRMTICDRHGKPARSHHNSAL
jgi:tRNA pseudouridine32 synthase/23S rRNA pseudouridine746 synthase